MGTASGAGEGRITARGSSSGVAVALTTSWTVTAKQLAPGLSRLPVPPNPFSRFTVYSSRVSGSTSHLDTARAPPSYQCTCCRSETSPELEGAGLRAPYAGTRCLLLDDMKRVAAVLPIDDVRTIEAVGSRTGSELSVGQLRRCWAYAALHVDWISVSPDSRELSACAGLLAGCHLSRFRLGAYGATQRGSMKLIRISRGRYHRREAY